ncbi:hypothetical protein HXA34_19920 [Salipaludibacillus agaradhaerens]|uniref:hypothetical protein n=1 Tax=Salipaludibacillus agaradhaerens TaxID=76935 RepID=UPI002150F0F3|nr:hypothetical protein [Salipaludibacillus agaradhaerens]MCR6108748.1 hypothetical protein [Salipaludibacillus agaradhaerens]MCR6120587.1 hypothetical protein [Salipaludibacillus agaradhaerens]
MLGTIDKQATDVRYQDIAEYATMVMLSQTMGDLKKQGIRVTPSLMQEFRDKWMRDGAPMDFATTKAKPSDFARLLRSTGATSFGKLDEYPSLEEGIEDMWAICRNEYDKHAQEGNYLHAVTDPTIRHTILDGAKEPMQKAFFIHKGGSARELNVGDAVTFYDRTDGRYTFSATVGSGKDGLPLNGFGQAPVPSQNATKPSPEANPEDFNDIVDEQFLGWHGGEFEGKEYRGLSHVMGAYLTKADAELVAKNIDPALIVDSTLADNSVELLKHMRSNGYDFNVRDNGNPNQIEVRMNSGENINVRVFDPEANGSYIGRVYDAYNAYYFNVMGSKSEKENTTFEASDSIALLDYVTGHKTGKVTKSVSRESSRIQLDGVDRKKSLQVQPIRGRYRSLVFEGEVDAQAYIQTAINDAQMVVNDEFKLEEIQALIDAGLDDENVMITGPEFQAELEQLFSNDDLIREAQERAAQMAIHSQDGGIDYLTSVRAAIVGDYENGFNPAFVIDHMKQTGRGNERDAMMAALKTVKYDLDKIKGNDFAVNAMKERLIAFDPETAKSINEIEHPMLKQALATVQDTLKSGGFVGKNGFGSNPDVKIDENGIIRWEANRRTGSKKKDQIWQKVNGEIGQVMVPDENGIIATKFQGGNNYGIVPGYTGYFSFEGDYDDRMSRFRAKGFDQHLTEQLRAKVTHQMTRPLDPTIGTVPTILDASGINGLYHGDVYGKRIELDFMETNQLDAATKSAILQTLSNRVRFDNQFSDFATTSAETAANREYGNEDDTSAFSYWKVAGETNMRVLNKDIENYADTTMTGTGKTQGLIWYLTDGAEVHKDGSVTPSKGILQEDGTYAPDKTALQKLPYFDKKSFNAWDRNQMSANQLMTALKVDENVNTALMAFGGWTFDDSYAVSKEFADRNKVFGYKPNAESMAMLDSTIKKLAVDPDQDSAMLLSGSGMLWSRETLDSGVDLFTALTNAKDSNDRLKASEAMDAFLEEHGKFRPLQRGDKLSDFGGNKGTIGIVIDRHMDLEEAKKQGLDKEVRFMKANPELDVVSAPYSMLSRHNAGVVKELMDGETKDLVDPETGETFKSAMGQLNIIVTDMKVDDKTHAYTREDVLEGKGRKASGQLAWALQSKEANGILDEIYGRNDSAWSTYREYLIATGLDMKADGTIVKGYTPHMNEVRHHFTHDPGMDSGAFLDQIKDRGGFLDLPFNVTFKNGGETESIPVLSASLRQNVELVDGSMRRSDFTNHYANIYEAIGDYQVADTKEAKEKAQAKAQDNFDKIQSTIIDRQFDGGHNGKHSFIRDKIMGKRMNHSATGVAVVDPRLNIGEAGMNQDMMDALDAKEGDIVMAFRDPVWRDGAIRAMTIVKDESVHGIAINPIADKSHDMDFDGDTMGIMKFDSKAANRDLINKFSHWANMIDKGSGKDELYFQTGMDLASAEAKAEKLGDESPKKLYERAEKNAKSTNPKLLKQSQRDLNEYSHKLFREHGFGGDFVSFKDDASAFNSFKQMVDNGAKGSPKKLEDYKEYHTGKKTEHDAREIQYATGVKSDDTGLAGAFSQKLVSIMRNQDITAALESMYPLTQGTLQIKHDADHARTVNEILTDDMNKTFRGKDVHDSKRSLTPHAFKAQLSDIMENKMGVDVNEKFINSVTETLTHNGQILPLKEAMGIKGSPMDRVAYGGGYDELNRLADNGESLLQGEQNKRFAPFTMRDATDQTKLAKKDTQRIVERMTPTFETVKGLESTSHVLVEEDVEMAL